MIEDPGGRVTHVFHRQPDATRAFVDALDAFHISGPADAWDQRQRPLEDANYFTDSNAVRTAPQEIASAFPFLLSTKPCRLRSRRIALRNFLGMASRAARSAISTGWSRALLASSSSALRPH